MHMYILNSNRSIVQTHKQARKDIFLSINIHSCRSRREPRSQPLVHEVSPVLAQQHNQKIVLLAHAVTCSLVQRLRWLILEPAQQSKMLI